MRTAVPSMASAKSKVKAESHYGSIGTHLHPGRHVLPMQRDLRSETFVYGRHFINGERCEKQRPGSY